MYHSKFQNYYILLKGKNSYKNICCYSCHFAVGHEFEDMDDMPHEVFEEDDADAKDEILGDYNLGNVKWDKLQR